VPTPLDTQTVQQVWPAPPAQARIGHVQSFSRAEDLGITRNWFQRAVDFVFGAAPQRLVRPTAVLEGQGVIYVADPGAQGVHRFDRHTGRYTLIHAEGDKALSSPIGLAWGEAGVAYVSDSALGAVFQIRPGAEAATRLPLNPAPQQPTGLAVDPQRQHLYVVDTAQHCIHVYGADGTRLHSLGRRGGGDGEFNFPTLLWRNPAGQLLVTDALNFRTQILTADGQFVAKFGRVGDSGGDAPRQKGVATDRHGHVYTVDALLSALQVFDARGQLLLSIGGLGHDAGEFWLPTGVYVGADDMIYVADSYNQRVQVFRYLGDPT
jgi:DNA-binding beta-propeller fold protein YncE